MDEVCVLGVVGVDDAGDSADGILSVLPFSAPSSSVAPDFTILRLLFIGINFTGLDLHRNFQFET